VRGCHGLSGGCERRSMSAIAASIRGPATGD
jgi:hypothetical protein